MTILLWGAVAASSLLIGAVLATLRRWPVRAIGLVLAFGAGALISSVSFELAEAGMDSAGPVPVGVGLVLGALAYFTANGQVERRAARAARAAGGSGAGNGSDGGASSSGTALTVGALLDGIPEQVVLGIGLAAGEGVSLALLVAIFMSNLPESIAGTADSLEAGQSKKRLLVQWALVSVVCTLATGAGGLLVGVASAGFTAGVQGFAAGALLVMLVDTMVPEAREKGGESAGLLTVVGFALGAFLSLAG